MCISLVFNLLTTRQSNNPQKRFSMQAASSVEKRRIAEGVLQLLRNRNENFEKPKLLRWAEEALHLSKVTNQFSIFHIINDVLKYAIPSEKKNSTIYFQVNSSSSDASAVIDDEKP